VNMDLTKMDPMARKMNVHTEAFSKALEDGQAEIAREHLTEILKFGNFLQDDLVNTIEKAPKIISPINEFANGVPVRKFNEKGTKFDVSQRGDQLPGTIISSRTHSRMRPHHGTFGRAYRPE